MAENGSTKFQLPEASWNTLKKIIRAYYAKRNSEQITVQEVAEAAGLHRPAVSANNNFLRAFGVLEQQSNKLTPIGSELGLGVTREDEYTIKDCLGKLIESCQPLRRLRETIQARGQIERQAFNTQLLLALNVDSEDRRVQWVGSILDIFEAGGKIIIDGDTILPALEAPGTKEPLPANLPARGEGGSTNINQGRTDLRRIPIPVSPSSLWYVEIGENPEPQEIKKFLDMQRLIFDVKE